MEREEIEVIDCGMDLGGVGSLAGCCMTAFIPFR